jgi:predicted alpha/beta-fold hydrolase
MFEKLKANILFNCLLKRPDISKAYKMVDESDSWYDTISTVHKSLAEIQKLPHEILEIKSDDNLTLKGVYYTNNSNTTVIFAHGYTSHAEREWAFPGLFYLSLGYNVLIPYQRAHGLSEGKYITFGAKEHLDMVGWVNKINDIIPNGNIILHGLSMGGGIVLNLSKLKLDNVKCLIADAPSDSINNFFDGVSKHSFKSNSHKIAFYAKNRFNKEFNVNIDDFEVIEVVKNSKYPILLSAGSLEECKKLLDNIKINNPNETDIIILPGCNHGNGMYKQTELYQGVIKKFVNKYIG